MKRRAFLSMFGMGGMAFGQSLKDMLTFDPPLIFPEDNNSAYHPVVSWVENTLAQTAKGDIRLPLRLFKHQKITLTSWMNHSHKIHIKSPRTGGSMIGLCMALYQATVNSGYTVGMVYINGAVAKHMFTVAQDLLKYSGLISNKEDTIMFPNGSVIYFKGADTKDELYRGITINSIIVDDFDFFVKLPPSTCSYMRSYIRSMAAGKNNKILVMSSYSDTPNTMFKEMVKDPFMITKKGFQVTETNCI